MIPELSYQDAVKSEYLAFLAALAQSKFSGDIEKSYASRLAVATDNSIYQLLPQAVILPRNHQDLVIMTTLSLQAEFKTITFSPRGGGTGTNGQSLTDGIIVDMSRHMNNIIDINVEEGWVQVQTGVVKDQLNEFLKPYGFFFSPDLSTSNRATIGGMINTDASGQGSLKYGKTSDHVLSVSAVLMDGTELVTTSQSAEQVQEQAQSNNYLGKVCHQVIDTIAHKQQKIADTFPPLNRFLTGYDLVHLYDKSTDEFDLGRILCGSEGSLAFISEAKLNLTPIPKYRCLVNVKYDSFDSALRNAPFLIKADALSVETVDSVVLNLAKQDIVWHSVKSLITDIPNKDMQGINFVEFAEDDGDIQQQKIDYLTAELDRLMAAGEAGVIGYQVCDQLSDVLKIYGMRKKAVGLLGATKGQAKPLAFAEDTAVPPENLADYIVEFRALLDSYKLHYGMFGHVDAGVLHVRPALDMLDPQQEVILREISDKVVALTAKYKGLMWGEHGRGFRSEYGPEFFGDELFTELRKIKAAFDPDNRLNPGKICTPINSDAKLVSVDAKKRGAFDRQIPISIRESFTQSIDCNGNGLCFNYDTKSPMCPSFKHTGDRRHSPKGRAGLMREWLRQLSCHEMNEQELGQQLTVQKNGVATFTIRLKNSWNKARGRYDFSHEVMDAMQGCLACKACTVQCPVKVDVPEFRSRFIDQYHSRYMRPVKDFAVGYSENYTPVMAKMPNFFNFWLGQDWVQSAVKHTIGMVDIPLLSTPTLSESLRGHYAQSFDLAFLQRLSAEDKAQHVLIVQDPFTSFYEAELVASLVNLVEKLGLKPVILPFKPNGKPQHVKGFLAKFAKTAQTAADFLNSLHALGIPMVGVEPALVLCYRDEYNQALADKRGDFSVQLIQEWLLNDKVQANLSALIKREAGDAQPYYLFAHCTEKTNKPTAEQEWQRVFDGFGLALETVATGCCGMAGSYGHDAKNVVASKSIYGQSWKHALAQRDSSRCLATGYSCRSQVKRIDEVRLNHPIKALLGALG
ncbi:Glycolate dehydrogenase, subunit GlcD [Moritella sp. JT01]|uniref:D-2-hydroxyglutarate dehydrogenase YdiJ n=1 Tax=Moritella sp. JT01 TaxID=756698 RepID=UPI000799D2AD|nr:FAD-binding and (Fe-S)-binding domain-containing protein [Moritella sp. JT01]KXO14176.1 Glycolate dehydrogenase, subunit GlcD [Moritella sp. JT01]